MSDDQPVVYRCEFRFKGAYWSVRSPDGIRVFSEGFWIDDDFQLARGSDVRYWIPPAAIAYIEKEGGEP